MTTDERRAKLPVISSIWQPWGPRILAAATAVYSVVLVFTTHYPRPGELLDIILRGHAAPSDKSLHFMAYGVLGLLAAATAWAYGRLTPRSALRLAAALAAAAVIDELTQPLFERFAEPLDWVCDAVGIALGVLAIVIVRQVVLSRSLLRQPAAGGGSQ
jgi:VanZ family protein